MGGYCFAVEVLADEYELDHAVAVFGIPVAGKAGLVLHELHEFFFGSTGKPESGFGELFLYAGLFEEIRHVGVVLEVDDAFGADYIRRPVSVDEEVEFVDVESFAAIVYECLYAVFFSFAFVVVVMMVAAVTFFVLVVVVVFVVLMLVVVLVLMFVVMMLVMTAGLSFFFVGRRFFDFMHPCRRGGYVFEVEKAGVEKVGKVYVAVVAFDYASFGLDSTYDSAYSSGLVGCYFGNLVEEYDIAEFDLFDDKVLDVFFA